MNLFLKITLGLVGLFIAIELLLMIYRTVRVFLIKNVFDEWEMFKRDEYDWHKYTETYKDQVFGIAAPSFTIDLSDGKFRFVDGKIQLDTALLPLQESARILYEISHALRPNSILEVGCGAGGNLYNIKKILPDVKINGFDLLGSQIELFQKLYPEFKGRSNIFTHDITLSPPNIKADMVYTCTVIMHIHGHNRHLKALMNMFHAANEHVVLVEDWTKHDFYRSLLEVFKTKGFPWQTKYMYYYDSGKGIAVIISKHPLKGYSVLSSNKDLQKYVIPGTGGYRPTR
jgi:SAM-dependent methyltransferase